jgi:hypothetical protein
MFYTAGNGANGKWVEEAINPRSVGQEGYGYRQLQQQAILQQERYEDSDAMVVMKDDAELGTYSQSDERKMKTKLLVGNELGICNTVHTED